MSNRSSKMGFLSSRLGTAIVASVATGLLVLVACFWAWLSLGGGVWITEASLYGAESFSVSPNRLVFVVNSCEEYPEVSQLRETDEDVQVLVVIHYRPFRPTFPDCLEDVEVHLQAPLGDRDVVDMHTGQPVNVEIFN